MQNIENISLISDIISAIGIRIVIPLLIIVAISVAITKLLDNDSK